MKVQHLALRFWDQDFSTPSSSSSTSGTTSSLNISFKRLRPITPKPPASEALNFLDLKSLINSPNPKCATRKPNASSVETQSGGTRWNPTQEQINALEAMYKGGMRTPNAHQIERITSELSRYGRIEGKNVFYWFQNHKARERQKQKQKRNSLLTLASPPPTTTMTGEEEAREEYHDGSCKRKCRSWGVGLERDEGGGDGTLELFPLHPEGGK